MPAHPTDLEITLVPISGPLGLVDVHVFNPWPEAPGSPPLLLDLGDHKPLIPLVLRQLTEHERAAGRRGLVACARVLTGQPVLCARLLTPERDGSLKFVAPINTPAAPPPLQTTPDWAKGTVWYQIFPERFRNAHRGNDPTPWAHQDVFPVRWNAPWGEVSPDELEAARARAIELGRPLDARAPGGALRQVVYRRRYGGDLQGVLEQLDTLQDLGVESLYFTPVFRAASLHKYDTADYRHIDDTLAHPEGSPVPARWHEPGETTDPATWTWTAADRFVTGTLVPEIHRRQMRVIFDGVFNHTGQQFWAFEDLLGGGHLSAYASWYSVRFAPPIDDTRDFHPSINHLEPGEVMTWKAWDAPGGYLPALAQVRRADALRDLAPPVKEHLLAITRRWMRPDDAPGIDGWRLDVALDVGLGFWRDWRQHVKSLNPDALIVAEIWHQAGEHLGSEFDAQMNYPFARAGVAWLNREITSAQLGDRLLEVFSNHPAHDLVQMNLLGSHDTDRTVSRLWNPGRAYDDGTPAADQTYRRNKPPAHAYDRLVLGVGLMVACPGSPMVYNGDEWGVYGGDDPDNRKPVPWPDLGPRDDPDEDAQPELRDRFARWLRLRHDPLIGPVLRYGSFQPLLDSPPGVVVIDRHLNARTVRVVLNCSDEAVSLDGLVPSEAHPVMAEGADTVLGPRHGSVYTWDTGWMR